jgi:hypothetical protein
MASSFQIEQAVTQLLEEFDGKIAKKRMHAYTDALSSFDVRDVAYGCKLASRRRRTFPTPDELAKLCDEAADRRAELDRRESLRGVHREFSDLLPEPQGDYGYWTLLMAECVKRLRPNKPKQEIADEAIEALASRGVTLESHPNRLPVPAIFRQWKVDVPGAPYDPFAADDDAPPMIGFPALKHGESVYTQRGGYDCVDSLDNPYRHGA